ncbi:MAG: T9SS type A sorting domain-containing protein [Bacteroidales bacterium]
MKVFPNPAKDFIFIKSEEHEGVSLIIISDIIGNKITSIGNITQNPIKVNTSTLSKGVYLIQLFMSENRSFTKRLIIE